MNLISNRDAFVRACFKAGPSSASCGRRAEGATDSTAIWCMPFGGSARSYNPSRKQWRRQCLPSCFSENMRSSAILQLARKLFFFGGYDGLTDKVANAVRVLDLDGLEWSERPPLSIARASPTAVHFREAIFVLGGSDGRSWRPSIERWLANRPGTAWERRQDAPFTPKWPAATVVYDGQKEQIFLVSCGSNKLHSFDGRETWTEKAELPFQLPRRYMIGSTGTRLYLFDCWHFQKTAAFYLGPRDQWTVFQFAEAFLPPFGGCNRLTLAKETFYAVRRQEEGYTVMQFSLQSHEWEELPNSFLPVAANDWDQMHTVVSP